VLSGAESSVSYTECSKQERGREMRDNEGDMRENIYNSKANKQNKWI
jgi:hypothetical protein